MEITNKNRDESESALVLSSDDEWGIQTYSTQQHSSTSFSNLSDISIMPSSPSKENDKSKQHLNNVKASNDDVRDFDSSNKPSYNTCGSPNPQLAAGQKTVDRDWLSNNKRLLESIGISKSIEVVKWSKSNIISLSALPNEDKKGKCQSKVKNKLRGKNKYKNKAFIRHLRKQSSGKKVGEIGNHQFPLPSCLIEQLRIIHSSSENEGLSSDPVHETHLCSGKIQDISETQDNELYNTASSRKYSVFNSFAKSKSSERQECNNMQKNTFRRLSSADRIEHSQMHVDKSMKERITLGFGDVCAHLQVRETYSSKCSDEQDDKGANEVCVAKEDYIFKGSRKKPNYIVKQAVEAEIKECISNHGEDTIPVLVKHVTANEEVFRIPRNMEAQKRKLAEIKEHEITCRNEIVGNALRENLPSTIKSNVSQSKIDPVDELRAPQKKYAHEKRMENKRFQETHETHSNKKAAVKLNGCENVEQENVVTKSSNHKIEVINSRLLLDTSGECFLELPSTSTMRNLTADVDRTNDVSPRETSGDYFVHTEEDSWSTKRDHVRSYMWSANCSLPPTSRGIADTQLDKEDGFHKKKQLKKRIYLNAGILERIKHHLAKCDDDAILNKDLLTKFKKLSKMPFKSILSDTQCTSPSNHASKTAACTPLVRTSVSPKKMTLLPTTFSRGCSDAQERGTVQSMNKPAVSIVQLDDIGALSMESHNFARDVKYSKEESSIGSDCEAMNARVSIKSTFTKNSESACCESETRLNREPNLYRSSVTIGQQRLQENAEEVNAKSRDLSLDHTKRHKHKRLQLKNIKMLKESENTFKKDRLCFHDKQKEYVNNSGSKMHLLFPHTFSTCNEHVKMDPTSSGNQKPTACCMDRKTNISNSTDDVSTGKKCSERLQAHLERIDNTDDCSSSLCWPLPVQIGNSSWFKPSVVSPSASIEHSRANAVDISQYTENSIHRERTSHVFNKAVNESSMPHRQSPMTLAQDIAGTSEEKPTHRAHDVYDINTVLQQALISSLAENIDLKSRLKPLVFELEELKEIFNMDILQKHAGDGERRFNAADRINKKANTVRHRRMPLVKCAGDLKSMILSSAEIQSLRSKVNSSHMQVKDLTYQLGALKAGLIVNSKRSAIVSPLKLFKLKETVTEQRVKMKGNGINEMTSYPAPVKVEFRTFAESDCDKDLADSEPPCKKRRTGRAKTLNREHEADTYLKRILKGKQRTSLAEFTLASKHSSCPSRKIPTKTHVPEMTAKSANIFNSSKLYNVSGLPSNCTPVHRTEQSSSIESWAPSCDDLAITSCPPNAVSAIDRPLEPHTQGQQTQVHICNGQTMQHTYQEHTCCSQNHNPDNDYEPPISRQLYTQGKPSPFGATRSLFLHEPCCEAASSYGDNYAEKYPMEQTIYPIQNCRTHQHSSMSQYASMQACDSPFSFHNSGNKSKDCSSSTYHKVISSMASPSMFPQHAIQSSASRQTVLTSPEQACIGDDSPYTNSQMSSLLNMNPFPISASHSSNHQSFVKKPDVSNSSTSTHDSSLYWPSKPSQMHIHLQSTERSNTYPTVRKVKSRFSVAENPSKIKSRVEPFITSRTSPKATKLNKQKTFAFASGATVYPESGNADILSRNISRWLKSNRDHDDDSRHSTGLPSPYLPPENEIWPSMNTLQTHFRPPINDINVFPSFQSHRQHVRSERNEPQHHLQHDRHHTSKHQERKNYTQHTKQSANVQQKSKLYRYPKHLLSKPLSELPYPPLSPFQQPSTTELKKTNVFAQFQCEAEQNACNDFINRSIFEKSTHSGFLNYIHPLVQQGGPIVATTSIFKQQNASASRGNSHIFLNPQPVMNFEEHDIKTVMNGNSRMTWQSLYNGTVKKRQIEAPCACSKNGHK